LASVLILGATSGIGRAVAAEFARHGYDLALTGRDRQEIDTIAADLAVRYGVQTRVHCFDALAFETHAKTLEACLSEAASAVEGAILCIGYLGDQAAAQKDFAEARRILDTNLTACVSALHIIAHYFETRRSGFICAISSVAGDRGRQSNYLYGSAKGGLSIYLQGLRNRLFGSGVRVLTVKPGFVDTPMTFGRQGLFLVASPERVARAILKAIQRGQDVAYIPWFWQPIMFILRAIPERLFKRMRL